MFGFENGFLLVGFDSLLFELVIYLSVIFAFDFRFQGGDLFGIQIVGKLFQARAFALSLFFNAFDNLAGAFIDLLFQSFRSLPL